MTRRVTRPSSRCVPTMPTSTPYTMRLVPSKLRVQLSPSFPRRSLSQWDVCCEPAGGGMWANLVVSASSCSARCCAAHSRLAANFADGA